MPCPLATPSNLRRLSFLIRAIQRFLQMLLLISGLFPGPSRSGNQNEKKKTRYAAFVSAARAWTSLKLFAGARNCQNQHVNWGFQLQTTAESPAAGSSQINKFRGQWWWLLGFISTGFLLKKGVVDFDWTFFTVKKWSHVKFQWMDGS